MAASPRYKIYSSDNEYIASVKYVTDAAVLVGVHCGGTVRDGHLKRDTVWHEGAERFYASDSYDGAAEIILQRIVSREIR